MLDSAVTLLVEKFKPAIVSTTEDDETVNASSAPTGNDPTSVKVLCRLFYEQQTAASSTPMYTAEAGLLAFSVPSVYGVFDDGVLKPVRAAWELIMGHEAEEQSANFMRITVDEANADEFQDEPVENDFSADKAEADNGQVSRNVEDTKDAVTKLDE